MNESTESANVPVIVPQGGIFPEVLPVTDSKSRLSLHFVIDTYIDSCSLQTSSTKTTARQGSVPVQLWPSKSSMLVPLAATYDSHEFVRR